MMNLQCGKEVKKLQKFEYLENEKSFFVFETKRIMLIKIIKIIW